MSNRLQDWTVLSMLEWATEYFKEKGIPDPRLSIEWLLAEVLGCKRLDLYLKFDRPLSDDELQQLRPLVKRRASHEPLQYIIGHTPFHKVQLQVTPAVLIPRIETEQLVEIILEAHRHREHLNILDIGTGSGCIPIALKHANPEWSLTAIDISGDALDVARKNAAKNETEINFLKGDILKWENLSFPRPFDLIISNPPYVRPEEKHQLEKQVTEHEPSEALFCEDPNKLYGSIIQCSTRWINPGGELYLEVHENYAERILSLFPAGTWDSKILKDYEKKSRFIHGQHKK